MKTQVNDNGSGDAKVLLLDAKAVAKRIGCSKATIWRMRNSGKLPQPVKFCTLTRWRVADIDRWLADGCPDVDGVKTQR